MALSMRAEVGELRVDEVEDYDYDDAIDAIERAVYYDDKPKFVSLMDATFVKQIHGRNNSNQVGLWKKECCPLWILSNICKGNAIECLTALLNGEINLDVDLNAPFQDGLYPLHRAALNLSYPMVDLLLRHGARADIRTTKLDVFRDNIYPLNMALDMLCHHHYLAGWTEKQSIFKLIILLCQPYVIVAVEICRLLTQNMEEVNEAFNQYAMEGNLIEMTVLLMLAREKVLAPSMLQITDCASLVGSLTPKDWIATEMMILGLFEMKLMHKRNSSNLLMMCKKKKILMTRCLFLLEVFETVGDKIEKYIQSDRSHKPKQLVAEEVKTLMEEAGFVLKEKDVDLSDICSDAREREDIMLHTGVFRKWTSASQIWNLNMPNLFPTDSFSIEKKTLVANNKKEFWRKLKLPYSSRERNFKIFSWPVAEDEKRQRLFESRIKPMRMEQMSGPRFFYFVSNFRKLLRRM